MLTSPSPRAVREISRSSILAERGPQTHNSSGWPRMRTRWESRSLLTILLIAPLALAAASGANAQQFSPTTPGSPITTTVPIAPGASATVVGNTEIGESSPAWRRRHIDMSSGNLTINTESGLSPPGPGPISITSNVHRVRGGNQLPLRSDDCKHQLRPAWRRHNRQRWYSPGCRGCECYAHGE